MAKDKRKKGRRNGDGKPKKSDFKAFLRKRAPIYLALIALLVVFVIPELTKGDLEKSFPDLTTEEQQIVDILMGYNEENQEGLTVLEAIKKDIGDKYPDENIYDNKKTKIGLTVTEIESENYQVKLDFESYKGKINYDWNVDKSSKEITSNNSNSKHIIELVDFS